MSPAQLPSQRRPRWHSLSSHQVTQANLFTPNVYKYGIEFQIQRLSVRHLGAGTRQEAMDIIDSFNFHAIIRF
jgi:hypothetical protein